MPELTIAQRFRLGVLCEEYEEAVSDPPQPPDESRYAAWARDGMVTGLAPLARYMSDERVDWRDFTARDKELYPQAYQAAILASCPDDFEPGCLGHDVLVQAGLRPPDPV